MFPTTWPSPLEIVFAPKTLIPFSISKANPNFEVVRAAGVEPTTFGSGDQYFIHQFCRLIPEWLGSRVGTIYERMVTGANNVYTMMRI
jgi:hypothetical protein